MSKRAVPWWAGIFAGGVAAVVAMTVGYWWEIVTWLVAFEKLASWAQAFGAVVAIWAGFRLASLEARRAREEIVEARRLQRLDVRVAAFAAVSAALERVKLNREALYDAGGQHIGQLKYCRKAINLEIDHLKSIAISNVGSQSFINNYQAFVTIMTEIIDYVDGQIVEISSEVDGAIAWDSFLVEYDIVCAELDGRLIKMSDA